MIEKYVNLPRQKGERLDYVHRFFLFYDGALMDIEQELADSAVADDFYAAVKGVYEEWIREMGEEKWREVEAFNEEQSGANRNWWIGDVLAWPPERAASRV